MIDTGHVINRFSPSWTEWEEMVPDVYQDAELTSPISREWIDGLRYDSDKMVTYGNNLVLIGSTGSGKTYEGFAVCKELKFFGHPRPPLRYPHPDIPDTCRQECSIKYWSMPQLLSEMRSDEKAVLDQVDRVGIVFLDDIGAMRRADWVLDRLYTLLDRRRALGRPLIATANMALPALRDYLGELSYSRLVSGAIVLEKQRADLRGAF